MGISVQYNDGDMGNICTRGSPRSLLPLRPSNAAIAVTERPPPIGRLNMEHSLHGHGEQTLSSIFHLALSLLTAMASEKPFQRALIHAPLDLFQKRVHCPLALRFGCRGNYRRRALWAKRGGVSSNEVQSRHQEKRTRCLRSCVPVAPASGAAGV